MSLKIRNRISEEQYFTLSTFNFRDNNFGVLLKCDIFVLSFPGHLDLLMEIGIYIQPDMINGCTCYELKFLE